MKKLVMTLTMAAVLIGGTGIAQAGHPVLPMGKPFVSLSVTPDKLDLGTVPYGDIYDTTAVLTVKVRSNCRHGRILVSSTNLKNDVGVSISPKRIFVKAPTTGGFVPMAKPVAISKVMKGSHDIKLNFKVQGDFQKPAGKYTGTLIFTIMPPP